MPLPPPCRRNFTAGAEGWEGTWVNHYLPFVRDYGGNDAFFLSKGRLRGLQSVTRAFTRAFVHAFVHVLLRVPCWLQSRPAFLLRTTRGLRRALRRGTRRRGSESDTSACAVPPLLSSLPPTAEEAEGVNKLWLYLVGDYWALTTITTVR